MVYFCDVCQAAHVPDGKNTDFYPRVKRVVVVLLNPKNENHAGLVKKIGLRVSQETLTKRL